MNSPVFQPDLSGSAEKPLKVSVALVTYNHEKFIAQAVQSVLMQTATFPYEVVIGEDCSSDRTRAMVIDFQRRHPSVIRLILADKNSGGMENFVRTLQACQGQYIALLDGDDYWTDPRKLQAQVDFLDSHPDCAFCFHNATKVYDDEGRAPVPYCSIDQAKTFTLTDLLARNFIPTCSVMLRNGLVREFPDWFQRLSIADWPLHVLVAQHGNIGYLSEVMATYRVHGSGAWSGQSKIERLIWQLDVYRAFRAHLGSQYASAIRAARSGCYSKLSSQYERQGDPREAKRYAVRALVAGAFQRGVDLKGLLARAVQLYSLRSRSVAQTLARRG
jgi:glycosyltransferase involved in cell wall biosynthesis